MVLPCAVAVVMVLLHDLKGRPPIHEGHAIHVELVGQVHGEPAPLLVPQKGLPLMPLVFAVSSENC